LTQCTLGEVWLHLGQYEQAANHIYESLKLARTLQDQRQQGLSLLALSQMMIAQYEFAQALSILQESMSNFAQIGQRDFAGWASAGLGYAWRGLGNLAQARHAMITALKIGLKLQAFFPVLLALPVAALLAVDEDAPVLAIELYALAAQSPFIAQSRWYRDVAGSHIDALAATLPAKTVTTARKRGHERDWWVTAQSLSTGMVTE
jgi:tetratricopeptide (TPR) repeat protein